MKNELSTKDCLIYNVGDIIVITNMMSKPHCSFLDIFPIGLITEITYCRMQGNYPHQFISLHSKESEVNSYLRSIRFKINLKKYRQAIRPAMQREQFHYQLERGPVVINDG